VERPLLALLATPLPAAAAAAVPVFLVVVVITTTRSSGTFALIKHSSTSTSSPPRSTLGSFTAFATASTPTTATAASGLVQLAEHAEPLVDVSGVAQILQQVVRRAVVVQVDPFEISKFCKPGYHISDARVETRRFQAAGYK
jgi:hypothetical protein